jgi:hypothetical protein
MRRWDRHRRTACSARNHDSLPARRAGEAWGKATGPRTAEELARCRAARWKHGRYCQEAVAEKAAGSRVVEGEWESACGNQEANGPTCSGACEERTGVSSPRVSRFPSTWPPKFWLARFDRNTRPLPGRVGKGPTTADQTYAVAKHSSALLAAPRRIAGRIAGALQVKE